ncbi:hypothetical protein B0H11DRAFT_1921662 [Mycena galericulata]|nr:hypothetical protein B0H11DRAFT_1921662 [Mycena galericulata]
MDMQYLEALALIKLAPLSVDGTFVISGKDDDDDQIPDLVPMDGDSDDDDVDNDNHEGPPPLEPVVHGSRRMFFAHYAVSYDTACAWIPRFAARVGRTDGEGVEHALPELAARVGRTDGEGVERAWSELDVGKYQSRAQLWAQYVLAPRYKLRPLIPRIELRYRAARRRARWEAIAEAASQAAQAAQPAAQPDEETEFADMALDDPRRHGWGLGVPWDTVPDTGGWDGWRSWVGCGPIAAERWGLVGSRVDPRFLMAGGVARLETERYRVQRGFHRGVRVLSSILSHPPTGKMALTWERDRDTDLERSIQHIAGLDCVLCGVNLGRKLEEGGRVLTCAVWSEAEPHGKAMCLRDVGLVVQLGHRNGDCPSPEERIRATLIMDVGGIQSLGCTRWFPLVPRQDGLASTGKCVPRRISQVLSTLLPSFTTMITFRSARFVDSSVGMDGDDAGSSTIVGDRGIYISADGTRRTEELLNQAHKKRRLRLKPSKLRDALAEWIPVGDADVDELSEKMDSVSSKRKRYDSSDNPNKEWRPHQQLFLDETIRMHGLGDSLSSPTLCGVLRAPPSIFAAPFITRAFFLFLGGFVRAEAVWMVGQEWHEDHWQNQTLDSIGLIYQIGHEGRSVPDPRRQHTKNGGDRYHGDTHAEVPILCLQALGSRQQPTAAAAKRMVPGEHYRPRDMRNVSRNVNATDFMTSLERLTDARVSSGMIPLPDRYKQFIRMARQYSFLQRARRAGRGHDPAGLAATKLGELTVTCWACPHDGRNLPENWRDVDPKYRFLYMLLLAIDANFKLKSRKRTNEINDPSLGPGWGAFVEPEAYKKHLSNYVAEKDISTCIAFAALLQKDTRNTAGLRCSGVGGVVCARHECMRPNGLGDLQKGERYSNMDYVVMSALRGFSLELLTLSYDIACQWRKNLPARMEDLPREIRLALDKVELQCGLPVWHASSHEGDCQNQNSLSFMVGVGKTDGEGVERFWSVMNPIAYFTKDAGVGTRADGVEDKVDAQNFLKNLGEGDALLRKLIIAVAERVRQVEAFREVNATVKSEVKEVWQAKIDAFLQDRTAENPYVGARSAGPTEAEIRLALLKEEEKEARARGVPLHATSATAFLVAGVQLEGIQRRIKAEVAGRALVTADRESKLQELRMSLFSKLARFRDMQRIYTPAAIRAVEQEEAKRDPDAEPPKAERVKLWMPSELAAAERDVGCLAGVAEMEARMREGQCANTLDELRDRLHTKRHLIGFRDSNITGQKKATKAQTLLSQIGERADLLADKYRRAREGLSALRGATYAPQYRELKKEDMTLDGEVGDEDVAARKKLALAGVGKRGRLPRHLDGSSKKTLSWLWTAAGITLSPDDEGAEAALHESVRVEWSRAKARKIRWEEEVTLLREEMRRVLRYLDWQARCWDERALTPRGSEELQAGLRGYAARQSRMHRELGAFFRKRWSLDVRMATESVLASEEGADLNEFFGQASTPSARLWSCQVVTAVKTAVWTN